MEAQLADCMYCRRWDCTNCIDKSDPSTKVCGHNHNKK